MHSEHYIDGTNNLRPQVVSVYHHGDYSGRIVIETTTEKKQKLGSVELSIDILEEILGRYYLDKESSRLENLTGKEYLVSRLA